MNILFFESEKIWKKEIYEKHLKNHNLTFLKEPIQNANLNKYADADVIVCFVFSKASKKYLQKFTDLKLIATESTGYDHIDLNYCKEKNITVCNVPTYGERTVAEFALGLMLSISRRIPQAVTKTKNHEQDRKGLRGNDLENKKVGVIGTGSIGRNMIRLCNGLDMQVLAFDAYPKKDYEQSLDFTYVDKQTIFEECSYITLHVPLVDDTKHMLGKKQFLAMKKKPYIINTSRGGVIDTIALRDALQKDLVSGVALDVVENQEEYMLNDFSDKAMKQAIHDLIEHDKVILTPHLAFNSEEAVKRIYESTATSIVQFANNKQVINALR